MKISERPVFLAATVFVLVLVSIGAAGRLMLPPSPDDTAYQHVYGQEALLVLGIWFCMAWATLVLPWSVLLSFRLQARGRAGWLAAVPAVLSGLAAIAVLSGGAFFGLRPAEPGVVTANAVAAWVNTDFILLESIVVTAAATATLALMFAMALTLDALRPDPRPIDLVFS